MTKKAGDIIELQKQDVKVVNCNECGSPMVWTRPSALVSGDLVTLKRLGLKLTNAATFDQVCIDCELEREEKERQKKKETSDWFNSTPVSSPSHHDDDSSLFSGGSFGGGGFGGFGGGSFSGGGASGGW